MSGENIIDTDSKFNELLDKIIKITEELSYLKDLFQRRLLTDKQNEKLISTISEYLNIRTQFDRGECLIDIFKELLHVIDYLERDEKCEINLNLAEQIITIFKRRNFEVIDIEHLDNSTYYEVTEVEESSNISKPEIAYIISKGYLLNGKVIRPAKVKMYKPI